MYSEKVRREEDILDVKFSEAAKRKCKSREIIDTELNCFEWVRYFYNNGANSFGKLPCSTELLEKQCPYLPSNASWLHVLRALNAGKNVLELEKCFQMKLRKLIELDCLNFSNLRKCCQLPDDCSYVCYRAWYVMLFLMKDPRRLLSDSGYILFIDLGDSFSGEDCLYVLSDVRTVLVSERYAWVGKYCATSEILDTATRKKLCEGLLPRGFRYRLSGTARYFIRVRTHANEKSMDDFLEFLPAQCFEVEGGKINSVWLDGKRADIDVSKYVFWSFSEIVRHARVFKDPKMRRFIENRMEGKLKSSVYRGAVNMKLLEKLEKKQGTKERDQTRRGRDRR